MGRDGEGKEERQWREIERGYTTCIYMHLCVEMEPWKKCVCILL